MGTKALTLMEKDMKNDGVWGPGLVECYLFRNRKGKSEYLMLKRSANIVFPGMWQCVVGTLDPGEEILKGMKRELKEETGLKPWKMWWLESSAVAYRPKMDRLLPVAFFAAEVGSKDKVRLSEEHVAYKWVPFLTALRMLRWRTQKIAIAEADQAIIRGNEKLRKDLEIG
jgi:8-oxo-dGTP pyrophosphatase MutT (NUDIX family)